MIDWLAGLFEGDGCLYKGKQWGYNLNIGSVDFDVVDTARFVSGLGTVYHRKMNGRDYHTWAVTRKTDVVHIANQLLPYLGERRTIIFHDKLELKFATPATRNLAWAAGIFEAEGTVSVEPDYRKPTTLGIRSSVSMKDQDVIKSFQSVIGFGSIIHQKDGLYRWRCGSKETPVLYDLIGSYLGERRGNSFDNAISEYTKRGGGKQ